MDILVRSGIHAVHSFDLYGVLLEADDLGEQKIAQYEELAKTQGINPAVREVVVAEYRALMRGDPNLTGRKKESIVDALSTPIEKARYRQGMVTNVETQPQAFFVCAMMSLAI